MIGIYLSGTGNTKHCVEKLVNLIDDKSKCVPLDYRFIKRRGCDFFRISNSIF